MGAAAGIKAIIDQKGLRQKNVAQKAHFTEQQFSDMLNGRKTIRADYLPDIASALGVSIGEIFDAGAKHADE